MGFGSYDESEQRDEAISIRESDGEDADLHANDYEGTMSFDSGASTEDLLEGLDTIRDEAAEE